MAYKTIFNISVSLIALLAFSEILWSAEQKTPTPGYIEQGAKVTAQKYRFNPNTLFFQAGKPITIVLTSIDGSHSFAINALNLRSEEAGKGRSVAVEFTVAEPGKYEFYCAHGDHKGEGMTGTLEIVGGGNR